MLEVRDLWLRVGRFELSQISLSVDPGECHVIMGPTGAGKTLLLESIAGLRRPCAGDIFFQGKQITNLPVEQRHIAFVPQDLALFPHLTVEENILYGVKRRKLDRTGSREQAMELCEAVGIMHLLKRDTRTLSGGERQRVALVRALAPGCRLLFLDEPFVALHRQMRREIWLLLKRLQERFGLTVLLVTHDMEEGMFLGDSISVLIGGRIQQTGSKADVFCYPCTVQVAKLMGISNLFGGRVYRVGDGVIHVYCNDLGRTFALPIGARRPDIDVPEGADVILGIRSENVRFLQGLRPKGPWDVIVEGVVTAVFEKGLSRTITVTTNRSERAVEIEECTFSPELGTRAVGQRVNLCFSAEHMRVFPKMNSSDQL